MRSRLDVVQRGGDRLRVGPWHGDRRTAYAAPVAGRPVEVSTVDACLELADRRGYGSVLTAALTEAEQEPFVTAGFEVRERLHLLRHPLHDLPDPPRHHLRRGRWYDRSGVLEVDSLAFDTFWRFDRRGIDDARAATPSSRYRVAGRGRIVGYAITGRAGPLGYLQRLAVHPEHQGLGLGAALVVDALSWARARGAASVLVNTQERNRAALELYLRLGFVLEDHGLAVLEHRLPGGGR